LFEQEVLPQQILPLLTQNGLVPVVQQVWVFEEQHPVPQAKVPILHFVALLCAAAGFTPKAPRTPPANAPPTSLSAWRRGSGLARIRATSSKTDCTFPILSFAFLN